MVHMDGNWIGQFNYTGVLCATLFIVKREH